jgi:hypothetical protein
MAWYYWAAVAAVKVIQGVAAQKGQNNAAMVEDQNARNAETAGYANEDRQRRRNAFTLGTQRAAMSQSGFEGNTGSALELQGNSAGNAELDALTERYKGQLQGTADRNRANLYRAQGKAQLFGGVLNAASMIYGGAGGAGGYGG